MVNTKLPQLEVLKHLSPPLKEYALRKSKGAASMDPHPSYHSKPSAIKLFPQIGGVSQKDTYVTHNNAKQNDFSREFPLTGNDLNKYHHIRANDVKTYKNNLL